jgi:pseudouridine kinase
VDEASPSVVCIGASCIDRIYRTDGAALLGTSNPASCRRSHGGVARNVAENLANLGTPVALCSVVGSDEDGRDLVAQLTRRGVSIIGVLATDRYPTPSYAAIVGPDGSLLSGASDTRALEALALPNADGWWTLAADAVWLFADCNLPSALLASCIERRPSSRWRLAIDGTSTAKARRLPHDLSNVDLLFVNETEWSAIDPASARTTVILRGARGATILVGSTASTIPPIEAAPIDTTGAGDSLVAGTLHSLVRGDDIETAVRSGMRLAARALETHGAVPSLR